MIGGRDARLGIDNVFLEVADAREAVAEPAMAGVTPLTPAFLIPTGWAFELSDPWGSVVGFTDYSAKPELGGR